MSACLSISIKQLTLIIKVGNNVYVCSMHVNECKGNERNSSFIKLAFLYLTSTTASLDDVFNLFAKEKHSCIVFHEFDSLVIFMIFCCARAHLTKHESQQIKNM